MAKGLRYFIIFALILGVFITALLSIGIQLADINNANQTIADDPSVRVLANNLNESLGDTLSSASATQEAISESPTTLSTTGLVFDALASIWKTLTSVPIAIFQLVINFLETNILGSQAFAIVTTSLLAIIILTLVFFVVKWATTGDGG